MNKSLLQLEDLIVEYPLDDGNVRAVDGVDLIVESNQLIGLVGESGCGKSTLGFSIIKLLKGGKIRSGSMNFNGEDLTDYNEKEMKKIRGPEISMVFQASQSALNPLQKVKDHFKDTLKAHKMWEDDSMDKVKNLLTKLEIPISRLNDYPFQLSGGMRQRVVIALALILDPKLLIADEPTTALDVLVQARILRLLKQLQKEYNLSMIIISHDLGVVSDITEKVAIMYSGHFVEFGTTENIFSNPKHPYTQALIETIPDIRDETKKRQKSIPGFPPDLKEPPSHCRFAERCEYVIDVCKEEMPELIQLEVNGEENLVRCFKYDERYKQRFD